MIPWYETPRLTVDVDGILWRWREAEEPTGFDRLGPIAAAEVPEDLADELAECLDFWGDAFSARAEQEWAYRNRG